MVNCLNWGISEFNLEPKIHAFKTITEQNCTIKVFWDQRAQFKSLNGTLDLKIFFNCGINHVSKLFENIQNLEIRISRGLSLALFTNSDTCNPYLKMVKYTEDN